MLVAGTSYDSKLTLTLGTNDVMEIGVAAVTNKERNNVFSANTETSYSYCVRSFIPPEIFL